ncbi:NO-inducible flavohemoprotein [Leisingera daeponensis]|uniref:nitric oxide dioxygenase n=1 Tax=Leisingera daeponensis TaxID=405746 RepID=A0ABS7NLF0_9RHOB|nr:NO-inducible flavohemoprotein [Leisingera daeponensis]MBY6142010.1 NO-inducible flavohemoprotein [Leisingera daeponensis]
MAQPLSQTTIDTVKGTVPALALHGCGIVAEMYNRLLADPEIRTLFNQSHQNGDSPQHAALTNAILAYAQNIENLPVMAAAVERIANKHVGLQIEPRHYDHVASALLGAIEAVLKEAATGEVIRAWGEAYWFLANILIGREEQLYQETAAAEGGWRGWREFRIDRRIQESADVMSFILKPADGKPVSKHKPGQYLSFDLEVPGAGKLRRNYSISSGPSNEFYRITVKREQGGLASTWLHEQAVEGTVINAAAPAGEFFLKSGLEAEVVLLSAGVGLTPMISMLEDLAANNRSATYLHATQNSRHHIMPDMARSLSRRCVTFFEDPSAEDRAAANFDVEGRITPEWLARNTSTDRAEYYICGPKGFMAMAVNGLKAAGVDENRIFYEFFGPAQELDAA